MNAGRRKMIARAIGCISEVRGLLEEVHSDEQTAYDNMPLALQESERGERMAEIISTIENAVDDLENLESALEDAKS
jgi:C4-type Zn-finger protein